MKAIIDWLLAQGWTNTDACLFTRERTERSGIVIVNGQQMEQTQHCRYGIEMYGDGWISGESGCEVLHYVSFTKRVNGMLLGDVTSGVRDLDEFLENAVSIGSITPDEM